MDIIISLHSKLAYVVLIFLVLATLNAFWGLIGKRPLWQQRLAPIAICPNFFSYSTVDWHRYVFCVALFLSMGKWHGSCNERQHLAPVFGRAPYYKYLGYCPYHHGLVPTQKGSWRQEKVF